MYLRKPKRASGTVYVETFYCDENDIEQDIVVTCSVSGPEPDVGFNGDIDIECIELDGKEIEVDQVALDAIVERCNDHINSLDEDYRY